MPSRDVVLCHPVRTAIGTYNGTLKDTPATELGATVVRETLRRSGLDPARVGSVVMGNVIQAGNRMNPARQAAINGGVPVAVPALTVNRVCGSGAQAIASAAQEIWLGQVDTAIAGGMDRMADAFRRPDPLESDRGRPVPSHADRAPRLAGQGGGQPEQRVLRPRGERPLPGRRGPRRVHRRERLLGPGQSPLDRAAEEGLGHQARRHQGRGRRTADCGRPPAEATMAI